MKYEEYLKLAVECAFLGGKVIEKGFYREKNVKYKSFANPVTEYDHESERVIVDRILKNFSSHSILAEENYSGKSRGTDEIRWVIDPLDGTVNFTHGIPYVCVSIGVEIAGKVIAGVIYNPILDELYHAVAGQGAYLNKKRIHVSKVSDPGKSLVVTGFPYERDGRIDSLMSTLGVITEKFTGFRRLGSAAMDMAYVARGNFEVFYEENLKPWDTAAGKVLIEEAGGKLTDYYGKPYSIYKKTVLATNSTTLHKEMLSILKTVKTPD